MLVIIISFIIVVKMNSRLQPNIVFYLGFVNEGLIIIIIVLKSYDNFRF